MKTSRLERLRTLHGLSNVSMQQLDATYECVFSEMTDAEFERALEIISIEPQMVIL